MYYKIYELDPAKFLSGSGLAWYAALKKTYAKLRLLTDIDMLRMVEKGIRGAIYHSIYSYPKANKNIWKTMIKIKNQHIFNISMKIIYMVGQCRRSFQ